MQQAAHYNFFDLLYRLPKGGEGIFATSGDHSNFQQMLAFDPVEQFTLTTENLQQLEPFLKQQSGRLVGFVLSYQLGFELENISSRHTSQEVLGIFYSYPNFICFNQDRATLHFQDHDFASTVDNLAKKPLPNQQSLPLILGKSWTQAIYQQKFNKVQDYIKSGDIYQVNLTQKISGTYAGSGLELFSRLTKANSPLYGGYLGYKDFEFISQSPESFLKTNASKVTTQPIKGTIARQNGTDDNEQIKALLDSDKEQAELFMITDLLRNDLSKSCVPGSVKVNKSREIMTLNRVFHTYSEVEGQLKIDGTPLSLLLAAFPGGSITGCPKQRAMEIIDDLEDHPRGFYTGAFGFIDPEGDLNCAINIRSLIKTNDKIDFHVGGGVTVLSKMEEEFLEMEHKKNSVIANLDS